MNGKGTQEHHSRTATRPAASGRKGTQPLRWTLSLAVAGWFPVALLLTSIVLYKRLGLGNDQIAYYSSWLFLPWVLAPAIERLVPASLNSRNAIVTMEVLASLFAIAVASSVMSEAPPSTLATLFLLSGMCGVVHNVEAARLAGRHNAGTGTRKHAAIYAVALFVAVTTCHGLAVSFASNMEVLTRNVRHSWEFTFYILAGVMAFLAILHCATLPPADTEQEVSDLESAASDLKTDSSDRKSDDISGYKTTDSLPQRLLKSLRTAPAAWISAACTMLFLLPEGLTMPSSVLFFIDARHNGGLGLSPTEYGLAWGTIGFAAFTLSLLIGERLTSRLKPGRWMWLMALAATLPNASYLYLSYEMPTDMATVSLFILMRQAVAGFGLSLCLHGMATANGQMKTSNGQTTTTVGQVKPPKTYFRRAAIIALPMFLGGLCSGTWQDAIGYRAFFAVAVAATVVTMAAVALKTKTFRDTL